MTLQTARSHIATAALLLAVLSVGSPLFAQGTVRTNTPGSAFSPAGPAGQVAVEDIAGGRRFRGGAFKLVILRGPIQIPPATSAEPKLQKLVIHFRTSEGGPRLRSVELRSGSNVPFRTAIDISGDYTTRETLKPEIVANAWIFQPINVGAPLVVQLSVQFPGGFDSIVDPGEFVLTGVVAEFPRKPIGLETTTTLDLGARAGPLLGASAPPGIAGTPSAPPGRGGTPPVLSVPANQVMYALGNGNELLWYAHSGREDGTFSWAAAQAKTVGTGWGFKQVLSGGDGVIYAITTGGDLLWYRHDGRADGSFRWAFSDGKKVNTGWNFERVFSGGGGVLYALTATGDLLWFRHDGHVDGTDRWTEREGTWVAGDWTYKQVFSGGGGVIYAVASDNRLLWFRHDGRDDGSSRWAGSEGKTVGTGWAFTHIFSAGDGVIYAINASNQLLWYRHDGRDDGSFRWAANTGKQVGVGWSVKDIFSGS
jgi:hypothetical protein